METTNETGTEAGAESAAPAVNELDKIIEESAVEGLAGAMFLFLTKRGFSIADEKATSFSKLMTAEFGTADEAKSYPLSKSIASPVREALRQSKEVFQRLYDAKEHNNLRKLIRVIVSGETLTVIQDKLEEVMKTYNELK